MTEKELEQIQSVCRAWLQRSDTAKDSRLTIPAEGSLLRPVELKIGALLTFDNVLILSADDAETGVCYAKLIRQPDGLEEVFITPWAKIAAGSGTSPAPEPPLRRASQQRYQDAMEHLAQIQQRAREVNAAANDIDRWWVESESVDSSGPPRYLLYTNGKLLGHSLLERSSSGGQLRGRFYPSDEYFEYANIFEALPQAENDCLEANAEEAYGIFNAGNDEYRTRYAQLSGQVAELELYAETEAGDRIATAKIELQDLSHLYDDQAERWLLITTEPGRS